MLWTALVTSCGGIPAAVVAPDVRSTHVYRMRPVRHKDTNLQALTRRKSLDRRDASCVTRPWSACAAAAFQPTQEVSLRDGMVAAQAADGSIAIVNDCVPSFLR